MPYVTLPIGSTPPPIVNKYVLSTSDCVVFRDFKPNHSDLQADHKDYIKHILVRYFLAQVERYDVVDNRMVIYPFGEASATGNKQHNQALSIARATEVGRCIEENFDAIKGSSSKASQIKVVTCAMGSGDTQERDALGDRLRYLNQHSLEENSGKFRRVTISLFLAQQVDKQMTKVYGRRILNAAFTTKSVPVNHLDEVFSEISKKLPAPVRVVAGYYLDRIELVFKNQIQKALAESEISDPELFAVFKAVSFIIPSDMKLMFEFRDFHRNHRKRYTYDGPSNSVNLSAFDVLSELLSLVEWFQETGSALARLGRGLTPEQFEIRKIMLDLFNIIGDDLEKLKDSLVGPDGWLRKALGDKFVDALIANTSKGSTGLFGPTLVATDWSLCSFDKPGVYDISTFGGPARDSSHQRLGAPTIVTLDFSAHESQPLLGFQGRLVVQRPWNVWTMGLSLSIASYDQSNGWLSLTG